MPPPRQAVLQQSIEYVFPQLILGGEWTSVIKLTNRSSRTISSTTVYFVDNNGDPMKTTFQTTAGNVVNDFGFSFTLLPGHTLEGTFFGGRDTQFGHAFIGLCQTSGSCITGLYGEVMLKNKNSTRPDFESVFPLEQPTDLQYMLWDHRNGVTTVLYLVNESTKPTTVTLDFYNTLNQLIRSVTLPALPSLGSTILTLHELAPQTIGLQGTLAIRGTTTASIALVTATALRINPSNSFTPMRAFVPAN